MRSIRSFAPATASLALVVLLAACAQSVSDPASPTPSTPPSTPSASPSADPSPAPTDPTPEPIEVIELELPMIARSASDGVDVYARPSTDAPLLTGEQFPDMNRVEISLAADELVAVALGPLFSDGTSWYQVSSVDGGPTAFAFGWVSAEFLVRETDAPDGGPEVATAHGLNTGGEISMDVPLVGTPITVDVAMSPTEDQESCELDVTFIRTDGQGVNVATQTVTEPDAFQFAASIEGGGMQGLFQEEAGTVTLQVETDCSWAASLTQPAV
ncbi:MAG: hypothetical protein ACRDFY_10180 [Candidatus Limnocylindria bacterium]